MDANLDNDILFQYMTVCIAAAQILVLLMLRRRQKKNKRKMWVREIYKKHFSQGYFRNVIREMRDCNDMECYLRFFRMLPHQFDYLLFLVAPLIQKADTNYRFSTPPAERLAVTLRYLASGDMQTSLTYGFRIAKSTISGILSETCSGIWNVLHPKYVKMPTTASEWLKIADDFSEKWNFPQCCGAIDGKHVIIECHNKTGTTYYNYKGTFSIVLLAVCNANYQYTMVDVGSVGSRIDGGIVSSSDLGQFVLNQSRFPEDSKLPASDQIFPFFIVGDEAFPLKRNLMRPFPGKRLSLQQNIYNYRISRGRRTIENAFGILAARWRIFNIKAKVENCDNIVKACICLHNFLMSSEAHLQSNARHYCPATLIGNENVETGEVQDREWQEIVAGDTGMMPAGPVSSNRCSQNSIELQSILANYFSREGAV